LASLVAYPLLKFCDVNHFEIIQKAIFMSNKTWHTQGVHEEQNKNVLTLHFYQNWVDQQSDSK